MQSSPGIASSLPFNVKKPATSQVLLKTLQLNLTLLGLSVPPSDFGKKYIWVSTWSWAVTVPGLAKTWNLLN